MSTHGCAGGIHPASCLALQKALLLQHVKPCYCSFGRRWRGRVQGQGLHLYCEGLLVHGQGSRILLLLQLQYASHVITGSADACVVGARMLS